MSKMNVSPALASWLADGGQRNVYGINAKKPLIFLDA